MSKVATAVQAASSVFGPLVRTMVEDEEITAAERAEETQSATDADMRLVIEEGEGLEGCVYTIVDRRTGRVVSRRARDEVLRLRDDDGYAAGSLFDGRA